jgi:UDP-N-acetylglucosamine/UDP-N-acetyl-alpha-D-glucosaminouronate 4-epimerase
MRILVTGGAGFIGSHTVDALVASGHEVRVLDDLSSGTRTNLARHLDTPNGPPAIELIEGDVRDPAAVRQAVEGCDAVFHGAAIVSVTRSFEEPELVESVNAGGTLRVREAARTAGARRLVLASSCAVYGDPPTLPVAEDAATDPLSPYAAAKLTAEEHCRRLAAAGDLETVCLRYFNVYGPRQDPSSDYSGVIARFIDAALAGRQLTVFGDGTQTRDFVFVGDVVRANVLALSVRSGEASGPVRAASLGEGREADGAQRDGSSPLPTDGRPLNVGSGTATSVNEIADAVLRLAGGTPQVRHLPARAGDILHSQADTARTASLLGFRAEVSFAEGLARTFGWYQHSGVA